MTETPSEAGARVGLVLVSHSAQVAESVLRLAVGLSGGGEVAPLRAAGGTPDGGFGTDADAIAAAAEAVDQGRGVLLLPDLGSAVLTVRSLLAEGDELPADTELLDAPFLEGAVAALVTASSGADRSAVAEAAREAYDYRKE
ncbi:PTS-dependent dihydroxyacetone kinase phosphotransferase subunit DhaM [Streptomyces oceani]|uniref:PTS fructose transporter subunit IIA n=1 Tax=Streptomyces oceani TaxID=1075402 RepID=A0A1E7JXT8_9ACTN|nr:PTS fructose transporter subunit IIA [Streptomyces oceani]OEU96467.1 PTS fructose transporter subunit IIA [Streptomyces oceani]